MRLSTIAVCLLALSPRPALGCIEHDARQTGWFHELPSFSAGLAGGGAEEPGIPGWWLLAAGLASIALVAVSFRAFSRAAGRVQSAGVVEDPDIDRESPGLPLRNHDLKYA
jgi:hypothetical protein